MSVTGLLIQDREESVPLKSISVQAFLQGYVVGFRSTFIYENCSSDPLEVIFRTPVHDSYAVVDLEAIIDGRKIRAEIKEKEKAKGMYKKAIESGRAAAFGEENKGDIFSIVLGNLPPRKKAEICLTIVGELDVEADGSVRFVLPTVLKPRYTPSGSTDPLKPFTGVSVEEKSLHQAEGPSEYEFKLVISGSESIAKVTSPSHGIKTKAMEDTIHVILEEDNPKDIVILVHAREPHKPKVIIEPGLSDGVNDFQKSTAVMVSFFPEFKGDKSCMLAACEFVFIVDRSGSMAGEYICDAAQTLLLFLKSIPEGCYFNIIGFGSSYEKLFPESVPYNQDNLEKAVLHAEQLQADLGGTEMFDPLKYIFGLAQMKGLPRQVFVLTDGSVSNTESVIKLVKCNSHNARCFSFGIGSGASTALVAGIARAGNGTAEFITHGERMQPKVIRSLKKAMQPAVNNTAVQFDLPVGIAAQIAPKNLPPVFIGERTIVYGLLRKSILSKVFSSKKGSVLLSGDLLGVKIKHVLPFQIPDPVIKQGSDVLTIHHLASKRLIKDMELDEETNKAEIIKLSCDSNVISSVTGFIAIDDDQKQPVTGVMQVWDIRAPEPKNFANTKRFKLMLGGSACPDYMCDTTVSCDYVDVDDNDDDDVEQSSDEGSRNDEGIREGTVESECEEYCVPVKDLEEDQRVSTTRNFNTIISLQLASGAWRMTPELASIIGTSLDDLKTSSPVPVQGELETVWATVIALIFLQEKQPERRDEWELIAAKAEMWLAKQNLPEKCSVEMLRQKAVKLVR